LIQLTATLNTAIADAA